jgi:hypothetical protein
MYCVAEQIRQASKMMIAEILNRPTADFRDKQATPRFSPMQCALLACSPSLPHFLLT